MDDTTAVELVLFSIFIGPLCMVCPMLLLPTANFQVLSLDHFDQDFLLARSMQDWLISRSSLRFSPPSSNQPTPFVRTPVPAVKALASSCLEADPDLLYKSTEEVMVADVWFDFCRSAHSFLTFEDWLSAQSRQLPFHREISNAVHNLYLDVLVFARILSCRLAYRSYTSPTMFESKSSSEPKQKAHTRMREPSQKISRSIVAHSQSLLFWLFDCLVVCPGKDFPDSKLIRAIGNFLAWLWVILVNGDQEIHDVFHRHDLTHLHLGLGTSVADEILADISESFLFCQEGFPSLGSFQNRFIDAWRKAHPELDFTQTFTLIRSFQPRIAQTYQRLTYILNR